MYVWHRPVYLLSFTFFFFIVAAIVLKITLCFTFISTVFILQFSVATERQSLSWNAWRKACFRVRALWRRIPWVDRCPYPTRQPWNIGKRNFHYRKILPHLFLIALSVHANLNVCTDDSYGLFILRLGELTCLVLNLNWRNSNAENYVYISFCFLSEET